MIGAAPHLISALLNRVWEDRDFIEVTPTELADYKFMLGPSSYRFSGPNGGPMLAGKELRVAVD